MKWAIIGVYLVLYGFEAVVAYLNLKSGKKGIPDRLQDVYNPERYRQWLAYHVSNQRFALAQQGFTLVFLVFLLLAGFFPWLDAAVSARTGQPLLQTLFFLGIFQTILAILEIPFKIYRIFILENRFGFNRTGKGTFIKDLVLGYLTAMILGGMLVAVVNWLFLRYSENIWLFVASAWGAVSAIILLFFAFLNKVFLRLFNKFTPLPPGTLRTKIETLAAASGFSLKAISVMDATKRSAKLNAFFTGLGRTKEVVLFDSLLEKMSEDEVVSVLAHELGHALNKDSWRLVAFQIAGLAYYALFVGLLLQTPGFFTPFGFSGLHFGFAFVLLAILLKPLDLLLDIPINAYMRRAESRADSFSAARTSGQSLIAALKVLSRENLVNLNPHPLAVFLYYNHPPVNERVRALE